MKNTGRRRVDLTIRLVDNEEEDREWQIYATILEDIKIYLGERGYMEAGLQQVPAHVKCFNDAETKGKEEDSNNTPKIFMIENKMHLGFKKDMMINKDGLDYEHCVIVIAALANFHATSYCFRKQGKVNMARKYKVLRQGLAFPNISGEALQRVEQVFKAHPQYSKFSRLFLDVGNDGQFISNSNLESFGVLSHGMFCRHNLLFKYKSNQDFIFSCCSVLFQDLSNCHYGSCVFDLLQFIFTSVDSNVRRNFMPDFVCSVYYDSFAKTVQNINSNIVMFSKRSFIREFDKSIMYGFHFSVVSFSSLSDVENDKVKDKEADDKNEKYILALIRDVLDFKMCAQATLI